MRQTNTPQIVVTENVKIVLAVLEEIEHENLPGCVVECGVYQGRSLAAIAAKLKALGSKRSIFGFDSFDGLPEPSAEDYVADPRLNQKARRGYFGDTLLELVQSQVKTIGYKGEITLVPGWFNDTLPCFDEQIALLFLDCDFYDSYVVALNSLWDKVVLGGIVILDEYESQKYPGARRAVDEFFSSKREKPQYDPRFVKQGAFRRWFVRKEK